MSSGKRRGGGQDDERRPNRRHRRRHRYAGGRRKHLYLVLDDWNNGLSIHKIDPDTLDYDEAAAGPWWQWQGQQHLPEPPVVRLESPPPPPAGSVRDDRMFFSALGTKMLLLMNHRCAVVYDTETAAVSIGPHAPARMLCGSGVAVPAGGRLYALSHRFFDKEDPHSFLVMTQQPEGCWSWKALPEPPPALTWREIVVSHALHPDGRTIFMTTADRGTPGEPLGTYSFNTERSEWRCHGVSAALPFVGQGYFNGELDAWVGLHTEGYVSCCQVASRSRSSTGGGELDYWHKTTEEKVAYDYGEDWDEKHADASLTYMGAGRFCVVETLMMQDDGVEDCCSGSPTWGDDHHSLFHHLRFTMFGLKYGRSGELRITNRRSTRPNLVPRYKTSSLFDPFAFWI